MTPTTDPAALVAEMSREERLSLVRGERDPEGTATGYLPGVDRLDIPELRLVDGPLGVRIPDRPATAFPAPLAGAATFDPSLLRRQGAAMASEARAANQDVLLAPGLNIVRVPQCGRTFEYYSEDPVLTGQCAAAAVEGIQSAGVIATPKHYVANNQETWRASVSAEVSARALREIYLPGFRDTIDAGALAVMTAYNGVNGTPMSDHRELVAGVLKEEWDFPGFVMSDWFGTASTVGAATGGLDVEMPGVPPAEMGGFDPDEDDPFAAAGDEPPAGLLRPIHEGMPDPRNVGLFGESLADAIDAGEVPSERLADMVRRVLTAMDDIGLLEGERPSAESEDDHAELATEIAARGTVLLENDGVLPLAEDADLALIGPNVEEVTQGGGGSSETEPLEPVPTAEGIRERASGSVSVHRGLPPVETPSFFDLLFGAEAGVADDESVDIDAALAAAERADAAIVVVRDWVTEGADRADLSLPGKQDELVERVAGATERTVVVVQSAAPVEMPWRSDVAAILAAWYPGQADGAALARVLYGDIDASGRLPVTWADAEDYPATEPHTFPGEDGTVHYEEDVFVGYRHFDTAGIEPHYPFGYGNSYTSFAFREVEATGLDALAVTVENTGDRAGRAVLQAYVHPPEGGSERPVRELAGFRTVDLDAGDRETVSIALDHRAFASWDGAWTIDPGTYEVTVGRSSRDDALAIDIDRNGSPLTTSS